MSKENKNQSRLSVLQSEVGPAFIGLQFEGLVERITADSDAYLQQNGFETPALAVSSLLHLWRCGPMSLADLSRAYGRPHQLISIRLKMLETNQLAVRKSDPDDGRRKLIHLTETGKVEAEKLWQFCQQFALAVDDLCQEIGFDLTSIIEKAETALKRKPLTARMQKT